MVQVVQVVQGGAAVTVRTCVRPLLAEIAFFPLMSGKTIGRKRRPPINILESRTYTNNLHAYN